jgi:DNA-binding PadR family transcriptional regulator
MFCHHLRDRAERHAHAHSGFDRGSRSRRGRHGGGFSGRESRMFDSGELRLVILALIAEKPRHGYEVIKALGERVGGEYSPSPGVVYPTLTMLEDMGYATVNQDTANRKLYTLTSEGKKQLAENKEQVDAIFARLDSGNEQKYEGMGSAVRAMLNLRDAVRLRVRGRDATPEQIQAITDALDAAAKTIERI